jgi:pyruvate/2-oxoglutarate/acetoin dehydrogenase E1 component
MRTITYSQAGMEAVMEEMHRDPTTIHLATSAPQPLTDAFGTSRVRATPIAEGAFTGIALGAAGSGYRPIVNWSMVTFSFVAMDQIVNQVSKIHYMFGGQAKFPITFRTSCGGGGRMAAQHSQNPYSMFMNLAGLKMILPSSPYDLKGLLKSAIREDNPVISFEAGNMYAFEGEVPEEEYTLPLGEAHIVREGSDVTVVALGRMLHDTLPAAEVLEKEGVSVEVIDPRTLVPMDVDTIRASVQKTGRLVIVDAASATAGASAEIAAVVAEHPETFAAIKAPIKRICALNVPIPYSPTLEDHVFPDRTKIVDGLREVVAT